MTTVMPEGEAIRKAVKWVSAEMRENPDKPLAALADKAVFLFDLSPKDGEFLIKFFRDSREHA